MVKRADDTDPLEAVVGTHSQVGNHCHNNNHQKNNEEIAYNLFLFRDLKVLYNKHARAPCVCACVRAYVRACVRACVRSTHTMNQADDKKSALK